MAERLTGVRRVYTNGYTRKAGDGFDALVYRHKGEIRVRFWPAGTPPGRRRDSGTRIGYFGQDGDRAAAAAIWDNALDYPLEKDI